MPNMDDIAEREVSATRKKLMECRFTSGREWSDGAM